ncbi:MAG TPA: phosphoribosyltransferase [Candidatus Baltobacteraceae bacterium]|nr:phosphoribosyltransferase [Candidatus Baltobacteraceae bacterium]
MSFRFQDRAEAGRMLAGNLASYAGRPEVVVLGLPRGGVPVAYEVARRLGAPLDVFLVRKLGVPGHEELAMGAIASGDVCWVNDDVVKMLGIAQPAIDAAIARERRELERRQSAFREGPPIELRDRVVILVDDGLATGATMRAAALAVRAHHPKRVVVAVPVAEGGTVKQFEREVAETVCVLTPENFEGVGQWYKDFTQTGEEEARALLSAAKSRLGDHAPVS